MSRVKYEYKVVAMRISQWHGRAKSDYIDILNEYGREGWKFVQFTPTNAKPLKAKGVEMIFERKIVE